MVLISAWLWFDSEEKQTQLPSSQRNSDYAMTDFTMNIMDINGEPARILKGKLMEHFPHDDSTEITDPIAVFMQKGRDTWEITADHGHTNGDGEIILLTDNVVITNLDNPAFEMLTEKLTLNTVDNTAYTDQHVTIHSPRGDTYAVGLHADMDEETINLHSKVKGQYDAPQN